MAKSASGRGASPAPSARADIGMATRSRSGENVYPAEVEAILNRHPAVQEACVFGVPDPHWGETIKAVIALCEGAMVDGSEILHWCREHLAGYKRPRYLQFMRSSELPRSTTGKLQRHELARLPLNDDQRVG